MSRRSGDLRPASAGGGRVCGRRLRRTNTTIETPRCHGRQATIVGTDGNDVIQGTPGRDVIWGGRGDDTILGSLGNDLLCGGPGADLIHGGRGNDTSTAAPATTTG